MSIFFDGVVVVVPVEVEVDVEVEPDVEPTAGAPEPPLWGLPLPGGGLATAIEATTPAMNSIRKRILIFMVPLMVVSVGGDLEVPELDRLRRAGAADLGARPDRAAQGQAHLLADEIAAGLARPVDRETERGGACRASQLEAAAALVPALVVVVALTRRRRGRRAGRGRGGSGRAA